MAWTAPRTWVTGEIVTAALLNAQIKGNMDLSAPAKLTTAGDMLYATGANATARLAKGTNGNILHQASCAPAWTATPSITDLTLSGALDVNGTIDYDGTDVDMLSSGDIDLVSSANAAAAIYIAQSTGTSGTIKIHADTGTSVTEGAESINILSDVGGVGIRSTANLANAINLTVDGGTTSSIAIFNDTGSATGSICLKSDAGGITLNAGTFVTVGGNATNAAEIRMFEDTDNGCLYVALKAPNVATSYTITLPTAVAGGNCYVLTSTNAGVTSWAAAAGGPCQATKSAIECETNQDTYIPPDLAKNIKGAAKWWGDILLAGNLTGTSYNIACVCDNAVGCRIITYTSAMAEASYPVVATNRGMSNYATVLFTECNGTASVKLKIRRTESSYVLQDERNMVAGYGLA
jgi:hypothetical protein